MTKSVYYLTGMGERLDTGLGQALFAKGFDVSGWELVGEFRKLAFNEQVEAVASDLQSTFWNVEARVPLQLSMGVNRNIEANWEKFLTNKNELE